MNIPLKPSLLKIRRRPIKYIILHHTRELYPQSDLVLDNPKFQMKSLYNAVLEDKTPDINYNFVIEEVKKEVFVYMTRPFVYLCEWDDISDDINNAAIHIAFLGSYDLKIPSPRMYEIAAFRVISPFLKAYGLPTKRILLHSEVSNSEDVTCPGVFFSKNIIISMAKRYLVK